MFYTLLALFASHVSSTFTLTRLFFFQLLLGYYDFNSREEVSNTLHLDLKTCKERSRTISSTTSSLAIMRRYRKRRNNLQTRSVALEFHCILTLDSSVKRLDFVSKSSGSSSKSLFFFSICSSMTWSVLARDCPLSFQDKRSNNVFLMVPSSSSLLPPHASCKLLQAQQRIGRKPFGNECLWNWDAV